jgi:hypothetical protein
MEGMSDIRNEIEQRLGVFARPGAKAVFASPKYRAFVYRGSPRSNVLVKATEWMDSASAAEDAAKQIAMSFRGKPGYNSNDYFADIAQETPEGAKTVKNNVRFSRPGEKSTHASASDIMKMAQLLAEVERAVMHNQVDKARGLLKQIAPIVDRNRDSNELDSQGMVRAFNDYKKQLGFSRPGEKAKFGVSSYEQAENQIALTEERIASYRKAMADTESWIKRANAMMSKADVGDEKAINEIIGIARMLETNMKSRGFSRPGAKAEMAKWESTLTKKYGKPIEEYTARLKGGLFKIEVAEGTDGPYAVLYRWDDLRGAQRIASGNLQSLMRQAESMGAKEARGVAAIERISNYSRFGAKEKFATSDELFRKLRLIYAYIDNEANDISDKQMSDWKKIVDEAMSSGDENIKRLAKRVKDAVGFSRPGAKAK